MTNVFQNYAKKWKNSHFVIIAYLATALLSGVGLAFLFEDAASTIGGIRMLQEAFNMKPVTWQAIIYLMGITPELVQIVFGYMTLSDPENKWKWSSIAFAFFLLDIVSDVQYRSDGQFIDMKTGEIGTGPAVISALGFGIMYFTIASNLFVSVGLGMLLEIMPNAMKQFQKLRVELREARDNARDIWNDYIDSSNDDRPTSQPPGTSRPGSPSNGNLPRQPITRWPRGNQGRQ